MMTYAFFILGPISYTWYIRVLPRLVPVAKNTIITRKQTIYKVNFIFYLCLYNKKLY